MCLGFCPGSCDSGRKLSGCTSPLCKHRWSFKKGAPGVRTATRGAATQPEVLITCSEQETDLRCAEWRVQSVLFPRAGAEQGQPYGPVVEQLSLEKEQLGAPTIWAKYKTLHSSLCVAAVKWFCDGERWKYTVCALTWAAPPPSFPGCPGLPLEPLRVYLRGHLQQMPFQLHPTASAQRGSLPLSLEHINVIPLTQPPLACLAGCRVYLKSA